MFRSTLFLRFVIIILAALPLLFMLLTSPSVIKGEVGGGYDWVLVAVYVSIIPFWTALLQGFKLLQCIDAQSAFTARALRYIRIIKYAAISIAGFYTAILPYVFRVADKDDAPGVILINLILIGAALVVSTFAAVLQQLFQTVIVIKDENDLTV